jgi:hypothetical protein
MNPPVMAARSPPLLASPQIAGVYVGLVCAGAIFRSSFAAALLITRLGPRAPVSVCQTSVPMGGVLAGFGAPPLVLSLDWSAALRVHWRANRRGSKVGRRISFEASADQSSQWF